MDFFIREYINNNLPIHMEAVYNEPTWLTSIDVAGDETIDIAYNRNSGVEFIIVHKMQMNASTNYTSIVGLYDIALFPAVIFRFPNGITWTQEVFDFNYIVKRSNLKLIIRPSTGALKYSVLYQTVTLKSKNK